MESLSPYARFVVEQLEVEDQETFKSCLESDNGWSSFEAQLHEKIYSNSQLRFRFVNDSQNIPPKKAIFEAAFKKAHEEIIDEIEQQFGAFSYPQWKQFIWIDIPRGIHECITNVLMEIAIKVALFCKTMPVIFREITRISDAIYNFVAVKIAPYFIDNVPVEIVRLFSTLVKCYKVIYSWLVALYLISACLNLIDYIFPDIPYFAKAVEFIDEKVGILATYIGLFPVVKFLFDTAIEIGSFIWRLDFNAVGLFFFQIAEKSDRERIELGKQQAYQLWMEQSLA